MDSSTPSSTGVALPALLSPPAVTSSLIIPSIRGPALVITTAVCITLMFMCVTVRFYTKIYITKTWGWDDWTCILATIGSIGFAATSLSTLGDGSVLHEWNRPFTGFTPSLLRKFVVLDLLYTPTILMAKLSVLLLYLRIFCANVRLRYCIYVSMGILFLFYCGIFIALAILSVPKPEKSQLAAIFSVNTNESTPLGTAQGAVGVGTDFLVFCLPLSVIWKLQLPPRKKIGVLAIFMTGLLACIASAFSLYYRVKRVTSDRSSDVAWKIALVLLWVIVELTVGIICSCLISFPGFFRYHMPLLMSMSSFLTSSFKSLQHSRLLKRSNNPSNISGSKSSSTNPLAIKDIKVGLGFRVDRMERFISPGSIIATDPDWLVLSQSTHHSPAHANDITEATRRAYYEEMV